MARNPNNISNPKTLRKYEKWAEERGMIEREIPRLKAHGYEVIQTLKAGQNSSWSYSHNGKVSGLGFDSPFAAWEYIINHQTTTDHV